MSFGTLLSLRQELNFLQALCSGLFLNKLWFQHFEIFERGVFWVCRIRVVFSSYVPQTCMLLRLLISSTLNGVENNWSSWPIDPRRLLSFPSIEKSVSHKHLQQESVKFRLKDIFYYFDVHTCTAIQNDENCELRLFEAELFDWVNHWGPLKFFRLQTLRIMPCAGPCKGPHSAQESRTSGHKAFK